jgi:tRNA modification GTPase
MSPTDTIVALSSAAAPSARAVVRTSGELSLGVAAELAGARPPTPSARQCVLRFDDLRCPAWVYVAAGPRSYTGEDSVEYHIPGNPILVRMLMNELLRRGLRTAEPGEFTARAYLNGRLDLTAAEGVALAVSAHSEQEVLAARRLMSGELARRVTPVLDLLAETVALLEAGIDFADEGIDPLPPAALRERLAVARHALDELRLQAPTLERLSHEPTLALVGRPNAGKSSLLNVLAGFERAVASPVAGTTRDALSAEVSLRRGIVRLIDVAGLDDVESTASGAGQAQGDIERQMQQTARRAFGEADFILLVVAADDDRPLLSLDRKPDLVIVNKTDLGASRTAAAAGVTEVQVSAATGWQIDTLRDALDRLAFGKDRSSGADRLALNARHLAALSATVDAIDRAKGYSGIAAELSAAELHVALEQLGSIVGRLTPDDLLGRIFSRFCIGK